MYTHREESGRSEAERAFIHFARLESKLHSHYVFRILRLERTIREFLRCDAVSDPQRTQMIDAVYGGGTASRRDMKLLTDTERCLLDQYHDLDHADRQLLRLCTQ